MYIYIYVVTWSFTLDAIIRQFMFDDRIKRKSPSNNLSLLPTFIAIYIYKVIKENGKLN